MFAENINLKPTDRFTQLKKLLTQLVNQPFHKFYYYVNL